MEPRRRVEPIKPPDFLPTGCLLLNLAMSDQPDGGFGAGKMSNVIGDSTTGKTMLVLDSLARACFNRRFDGYDFKFDDAEHSLEFDINRLFGPRLAERLMPPRGTQDSPEYSTTIQEFRANFLNAISRRNPCVYVLDSLDAISSDEEIEKVDKQIEAMENDKKQPAGTYGAEKAKAMAQILRLNVSDLYKTNSILIVISQTRDNLGGGLYAPSKVRSGGRALKFFSTHEMWLSLEKRIEKKGIVIGGRVQARITKNKITGKYREVTFPIYYDYGVDDLGASIDYLVAAEALPTKKEGKILKIEVGDQLLTPSQYIQFIEEHDKKSEIDALVAATWQMVEASLSLDRKPKYGNSGD